MTRRLLVLCALLAALALAVGGPAAATEAEDAAATWSAGDPVYISPESGALSAEDAEHLRERISGWRDDVFVAVLPAASIRAGEGDDLDQASALIDDLYFAMGERDGIYLVSFSGAGTYASGYGEVAGAQEVGRIMAGQVGEHTKGQLAEILDGTLDQLGAPGGGTPVLPVVLALVAGLAIAGGGMYLWQRRQRGPRVRESGETWAGPADFQPSFPTYGDQSDTVEDRAALAREDVTRLGEELDAADPPLDDPAVAAHVQAALDAYADASRRVDALTTDEELREIGQVNEYARWQLAAAQAAVARTPAPARRLPCFVDPSHGISVADVSWAPPGGTLRPVPVCRACYDRLTNGDRA